MAGGRTASRRTASHCLDAEVDPATINVVDAIDCRLNTDTYGALTMALDEEAKRRGWRPVEGKNAFLQEYELPQPIRVGEGWTTRRVAFSANALLAILDITDPKTVADRIGVTNTMPDLSGQGVAAKFLASMSSATRPSCPRARKNSARTASSRAPCRPSPAIRARRSMAVPMQPM